jgi:hypothetical protein
VFAIILQHGLSLLERLKLLKHPLEPRRFGIMLHVDLLEALKLGLELFDLGLLPLLLVDGIFELPAHLVGVSGLNGIKKG